MNLSKMRLSTKSMIGIGVCVVIALAIFTGIISTYEGKIISSSEDNYNQLLQAAVNSQMEAQLDSARMSVLTISNNTRIQELFANRDRQQLLIELSAIYETLKEDVSQIQFHLPDSTAFLRLHMPENYGDSLKDFRFTVNEANAKLQIVEGLEEGRGGYGFRVVVPMYYLGQHTGSVEYGSTFGDVFLKNLQNRFAGEYFIYTLTEESLSWLENNSDETGYISSTTETDQWQVELPYVDQIKSGKTISLVSADEKNSILLIPYTDYKGDVGGYIKAVADRGTIMAHSKQLQTTLIFGSCGIAIFLSVIIYLFIRSAVIKPILQLKDKFKSVENGDFTVKWERKSEDEIGQLSESFNNMVATFREILRNLQDASEKVSRSSSDLAETSHQNTAASEEVAKAVDGIADGAMDQTEKIEMGSNNVKVLGEQIEKNTKSMDELSLSIAQVFTNTQSGMDEVESLNNIYQQTDSAMQDVQTGVLQTAESTKKISESSKMIASISAQTNLLALNASIEAARAGEAGKGFAVVADEIRKLAEESNSSTKIIDSVVEELSKSSDQAVETLKSSFTALVELQKAVEKIRAVYKQIEQATEVNHTSCEELNLSMKDMEKMKEEILNALQTLALIAESNSAATEEVSASVEEQTASMADITNASENLKELAVKLGQMVSRYKV